MRAAKFNSEYSIRSGKTAECQNMLFSFDISDPTATDVAVTQQDLTPLSYYFPLSIITQTFPHNRVN